MMNVDEMNVVEMNGIACVVQCTTYTSVYYSPTQSPSVTTALRMYKQEGLVSSRQPSSAITAPSLALVLL